MASIQCYKPTNETCQQKCLDNCYGDNKHNNSTRSYYSGHSTAGHGQNHSASRGQGYYPGGHTMAKPNTNSTDGQVYGHQQGNHMITDLYNHFMTKFPDQSYIIAHDIGPTVAHDMAMKPYGPTIAHDMANLTGHAHGQSHRGYSEHQSYSSHGMMMMKRRDCNRSGDSSNNGSDSDCN
uniref:Uncharacterized protein n=1 Tax=Cannabis sativa TaxID=3483 RepID=A0A803PNX7_CANSA